MKTMNTKSKIYTSQRSTNNTDSSEYKQATTSLYQVLLISARENAILDKLTCSSSE